MVINSKLLRNITFSQEEIKALNAVLIILDNLDQELDFGMENIETGEVIESGDIQRARGLLHGLWLGGWWEEREE